jgi:DNA-binding response OmpR family regulator
MEGVLIVEDDDDLRELCGHLLAGAGYSVSVAASAPDALAALDREVPAVILLDLTIPGSAEAIAAAVRARTELAGTALVVVSGVVHLEEAARALGAAAWVRKPYLLDELLHAVRSSYSSPPGRRAGSEGEFAIVTHAGSQPPGAR